MGHIEIEIELTVDNANIYLLIYALFARFMMNRTPFLLFEQMEFVSVYHSREEKKRSDRKCLHENYQI